jgi:segregation and condensation protein B
MFSRPANPAAQLSSASSRYAGAWAAVMARHQHAATRTAHHNIDPDNAEHERPSPPIRDPNLSRLESVLFLAREPLTSRKLSQYANLADGTQARTLVRRLNEQYDAGGRAFRVEQVAGGYQLLTRRKLAPWLRRLAHVPGETRLSAPALETLAVIAYRQPVPRADIEAIRGVNCGEILRQLMDRDLVRIGGRSDELGRPYLYATTKRFLQVFGLNHAEELPDRDLLRESPLPASPPLIPAATDEANGESEASDVSEAEASLADDYSDENETESIEG